MQDAGFQVSGVSPKITYAATYNIFNVQRHLISARTHRAFRASAMNMWREAVALKIFGAKNSRVFNDVTTPCTVIWDGAYKLAPACGPSCCQAFPRAARVENSKRRHQRQIGAAAASGGRDYGRGGWSTLCPYSARSGRDSGTTRGACHRR